MDWVSFDEIKRRVTLRMVIDHYGIELRLVGPNTLRGKCPPPSHGSEKSKESFTATLNKGVGGAWACQSQSCAKSRGRIGGNVLDLVAAIEGCSIRDAAIKLQTWFLVPAAGQPRGPDGKEPSNGNELVSEKHDSVGESEANKPLTFTLQKVDHAHAYLSDRGITEDTARKFGVGIFPGKGSMHGRCVIPIHNQNGELVAYAGRSIDGSEPRYKFPAGFHKSQEVFNLDRVKGESAVVLVEGFFDCMKVTQAGFPCVALMGSAMSKVQQNLLAESLGRVVLMLDGDEVGRKATEEIHERLQHVVYQVTTIDLQDGVQPDQLSTEELQNILRSVI